MAVLRHLAERIQEPGRIELQLTGFVIHPEPCPGCEMNCYGLIETFHVHYVFLFRCHNFTSGFGSGALVYYSFNFSCSSLRSPLGIEAELIAFPDPSEPSIMRRMSPRRKVVNAEQSGQSCLLVNFRWLQVM